MSLIDAAWIQALQTELQQVEVAPERAERLAELLRRLNATALANYPRLAFESEPANFTAVLHRHAEREEGE